MHEKLLYSEFFWSVFSRIRAEYGEIQSILIFYYYYYLFIFISHWPLLFYNNIAIRCKILYANLSQQLHTIKTN